MHLLHDLATGGFSVTRRGDGWPHSRRRMDQGDLVLLGRSMASQERMDRQADRRRSSTLRTGRCSTRSSSKAPCLAPNVSTDPRFTYRDPSITEPVYNGAAPPWDEPLGFGEVLWE